MTSAACAKPLAFQKTVTMPASAARVFEALLEPSQLRVWWAEFAEVQPNVGGAYRFWGRHTAFVPHRSLADGVITTLEAARTLAFSWTWGTIPNHVTITLREVEHGCELSVSHAMEGPIPGISDDGNGLTLDFWIIALGNLRQFLLAGQAACRPDYNNSTPVVETSIVIDAPPSAVYRALTDPRQMDLWLSKSATVEPRAGGTYSYGWSVTADGRPISCGPTKLLELEPGRRVVHDWEFADEPVTRVTWTLEPMNDGGKTRVTIRHDRFASKTMWDAYAQGWTGFLLELKSQLETGATI